MGSFFSSLSASSVVSQVDFYTNLEKTRIERELAITQLLEQRRCARKLAQEREKLRWTASGGGLMMLFCLLSAYHHKSFLHLLPVFPTVTYLGYQVHYCYGNKLSLIEEMSAKLHQEYPNNLALPPVNIQEVRYRMKQLELLEQGEQFSM